MKIHQTLFRWSTNRDGNVIQWVGDNLKDLEYLDFYETERYLERKIEQEIRMECAQKEFDR